MYVQVIKVETSPGIVETCNLTQIEQVASEEAARLAAMHHVGPIHTFMFSGIGRLLMANKRGRERYQHISKPLTTLLLQKQLLSSIIQTHSLSVYVFQVKLLVSTDRIMPT